MPTPHTIKVKNGDTKVMNGASPVNGQLEEIKKSLPHLDLDTGLKNRVVKRDPITGYGVGCVNNSEEPNRSRASSASHRAYNQTLISWDPDSPSSNGVKKSISKRQGQNRNPIALTGDLGTELDTLCCTGRPRTGTPREPQRDPISGRGNFGTREWDPIGKHNGRTRRAKSTSSVRCNPLTGENTKTYDIMIEERNGDKKEKSPRVVASPRNIFTGENCDTYTVSPGQKSPKKNSSAGTMANGRNVITGSNCTSYDVNAEVHTSRKRTPAVRASNPVNGENVNTFTVSQEERPRPAKPYVYRNTVTGENVPSYKITPIERNVTPRALVERQNPLNGENMETYTYRVGEGKPATKKRDLSSPLTGEGLSCRTYTISVEERCPQQTSVGTSRSRARSSGPVRNILTGENCETYMVCQEMRSERLSNGHHKPAYNILTGANT